MEFKFIHIPKTGGTSLKSLLGLHHTHKIYTPVEDVISLSIVRNPYDRVSSAWHYLKEGGEHWKDKENFEIYCKGQETSFQTFVLSYLENAAQRQIHFKPQHTWIPFGVDILGRYENFNSFSKKICFLTQKPFNNTTLKKSTNPKNFMDLYTPEMIKVVNHVYEKDFNIFNYTIK